MHSGTFFIAAIPCVLNAHVTDGILTLGAMAGLPLHNPPLGQNPCITTYRHESYTVDNGSKRRDVLAWRNRRNSYSFTALP